jgi:hypothetical protein
MAGPSPLSDVQRRVLGVLIEKALYQPQYYPMTVNAIVSGCNQKSNRDPEMSLDEDAVWNTLEVLRAAGLVSRVLPGGASRVERWRHEIKEALGWEKPQRAIMAELLLRGPQTIGELRGRAHRLYAFENAEAVAAVVEALAAGERPFVAPLPRAPGQSVIRYAHQFYSEAEWRRLHSAAATHADAATAGGTLLAGSARRGDALSAGTSGAGSAVAAAASGAGPTPTELALRAEVEALRAELAALRAEVDKLRDFLN